MPSSDVPVLYHNPRCSKSREALAMLVDRGVVPEIVLYLEAPLDEAAVRDLASKLDAPASSLLRSKEPEYAELRLSGDSPVGEIARAIASHPVLLERPILVVGGRAVIGRPLENFERLLASRA